MKENTQNELISINVNEESNVKELSFEDTKLLEEFNETKVEPYNHLRKELINSDCLSYL
jgi:hypothetical protein